MSILNYKPTKKQQTRIIYIVHLKSAAAVYAGSSGLSSSWANAYGGRYIPVDIHDGRLYPLDADGLPRAEGGSIRYGSTCYNMFARVCANAKMRICDKCGRVIYTARIRKCPHCDAARRRSVITCDVCGEDIKRPNKYQRNVRHICADCRAAYVNYRHDYHDWCDAVRFTNPNKRGDVLHLGYELEMHLNDDNAHEAARAVGEAVNRDIWRPTWHLEYDGSLHLGGLECITEACTLSAHEAARKIYADGIAAARGEGCYINEGCGLHVHIDRAFFGARSEYAGVALLYATEVAYVGLFDSMARRRDNDYYCAKIGADARDDVVALYKKAAVYASGHHRAINTSNGGTIEYRRIAAVSTADEILAVLDVVHATAVLIKNLDYDRLKRGATYSALGRRIRYASTFDILTRWGVDAAVLATMRKAYDGAHNSAKKAEV